MFVLVVISPDEITPGVHGPFGTVTDAQVYAERYRKALGLPVEATPENNESWTETGWYFGIFEPKKVDIDAIAARYVDATGSTS